MIIKELNTEPILKRMASEIFELLHFYPETKVIAIQPRGIAVAEVLSDILKKDFLTQIEIGTIDPTFYRDDYRYKDKLLIPNPSNISFPVENSSILLIDDVFYTGRTVKSTIDAIFEMGRPKWVKLMVLVYRYLQSELPITPSYEGVRIDTQKMERVLVETDVENKLTIKIENGQK